MMLADRSIAFCDLALPLCDALSSISFCLLPCQLSSRSNASLPDLDVEDRGPKSESETNDGWIGLPPVTNTA